MYLFLDDRVGTSNERPHLWWIGILATRNWQGICCGQNVDVPEKKRDKNAKINWKGEAREKVNFEKSSKNYRVNRWKDVPSLFEHVLSSPHLQLGTSELDTLPEGNSDDTGSSRQVW